MAAGSRVSIRRCFTCGITENDAEENRGVEMLLLVRDEGQWRIVSQAWDSESPSNPIPAFLTSNRPGAEGF
jgi:hypothetical protein